MELNHRFLFVGQESLPLDHGTVELGAGSMEQGESSLAPCSLLPAPRFSSCGSWNRTNIKTFRASRPTVRRSRNSSFSSGGRNRTYGLLIQSQASLPTATTPEYSFRFKRCPAGVEPASPAWKAGTSAARPRAHTAEGVRVELTRLIARLFSRQLPSPIGLPFRYQLR
jgi:hypothetical protein